MTGRDLHRDGSTDGAAGMQPPGVPVRTGGRISVQAMPGVDRSDTHGRECLVTTPLDWDRALAHLRARDRALGRIIDIVGPRRPARIGSAQTPFATLLRSIVYQQLSGKAAGTIHRRLLDLFPHRRPSARTLLAFDDAQLRATGLSRSKVLAVRDLAEKARARRLPSRRMLDTMDDETIIERLTDIRGVGRWTAEMLLIFTLARPDVLPVTDLGVRRGFMVCRGNRELPEPGTLLAHGEIWRPWRSVASWYLWRASEL